MRNSKSFEVGGENYDVVRSSALEQDEVLSFLTQSLIQRFMAAGQAGIEINEEVIFAMMLAMPFQAKKKIDDLLMSRITRSGDQNLINTKDFNGKVMEWNRLRTKVLMWNLSGFFSYWAKESAAAIESMTPAIEAPIA